VFGAKARRLAKAGAQGKIAATIGLVLGIAFIVLSILAGLAFIVWLQCLNESAVC
jgi:hypothetical protein